MKHFIIIALGGGLGAGFRHLAGLAALRLLGPGFPWGTMFVNVLGSFIMGLFIAFLARSTGITNDLRLFFATGFLGGFTTFSSFSLDFAVLWERQEMAAAFAYVLASVALSLGAVFLGLMAVRAIS